MMVGHLALIWLPDWEVKWLWDPSRIQMSKLKWKHRLSSIGNPSLRQLVSMSMPRGSNMRKESGKWCPMWKTCMPISRRSPSPAIKWKRMRGRPSWIKSNKSITRASRVIWICKKERKCQVILTILAQIALGTWLRKDPLLIVAISRSKHKSKTLLMRIQLTIPKAEQLVLNQALTAKMINIWGLQIATKLTQTIGSLLNRNIAVQKSSRTKEITLLTLSNQQVTRAASLTFCN